MCGRVRLSSDYSEIKIRLKFAPNSVAPNFEPDWNKPPTAPMIVAIRSVNGEPVPKMMKWGSFPTGRKTITFNIQPSTRAPKNLRANLHSEMLGGAASDALLSLMASMSGKSLVRKGS
jgi:putative SOS response-associated peptidase YedK